MSEVKTIATRDSYGNALAQLGTEHPEVPEDKILYDEVSRDLPSGRILSAQV